MCQTRFKGAAAVFNSDGLSILPCEKVRAQRGGNIDLEGPPARGQFPIFGTVGKMGPPPTESRAKTLKTVWAFIVLHILQWQAGEAWGFASLMASSNSDALRLITLPQEAGTFTYGSDRKPLLCDEYRATTALLFGMRAKSVSVPMVNDP